MTHENVEKVLALAKIGVATFPWKIVVKDGKEVKQPLLPRGHLEATTDPEQLATWFSLDFPGPEIGIGCHAGRSGLVVADLDRKHGKDGFQTTEGWLEFPETFTASTPNGGGKHYIYAAPEGVPLKGNGKFAGFEGLDRRGGSSWFAWWSPVVPDSRDAFSPAPVWLTEAAPETTGGAFEGDFDGWVETLIDPDAEPSDRVLAAIERIPDEPFGHTSMVEQVWNIVRLASEGAPGIIHALNLLRAEWLREPWNTQDYAYEFDKAVEGAISKAGALDQQIAELPKYGDLYLAANQAVENALSSKDGVTKSKGHWFNTVKVLVRAGYSDAEVASLLWSAPATKGHSREWGIEFVYDRIAELRLEVEREEARAEAEVARFDSDQPTTVATPGNKSSLLSADERELLRESPNFVHRYLAHAGDRFPALNPNYHRANALTVLSLTVGTAGFVPLRGKNLGMNLFQINPGESSSGKSDSIILRDELLRIYFADDLAYDFGSEASAEMMHEDLLARNGAPAFFNSDEAAGFFRELSRPGSWQAKVQDRLTDWFGGWCGPVKKRAAKDNQGGPCYLVSHFFSTPDRLFDALAEEQFLSGFLARAQWAFGDPARNDERHVDDMQADVPEVHGIDGEVVAFAEELQATKDHLGHRRPFKAGKEELQRLLTNERQMKKLIQDGSEWRLTESASRRLEDALRKVTGLLAASRGSTHITMLDVLGAIEQAEIWVQGLLEAASRVSSSEFERQARAIAMAVKAKAHPWITEAALYRTFSKYDPMEFSRRVDWGLRTGYITRSESGNVIKYGWRGHQDDTD